MVRKGIIVLLLLGILFVGGVYLYFSAQAPSVVTSPLQVSLTPTPEASPTVTELEAKKTSINAVVAQFYANYQSCLRNPPQEALGRVSTYCQANNPYTTEAFITNLASGATARRGTDPIVCSQNPPSSVAPDAIDFESPEQAVATVVAQYPGGFAQKIPVIMLKLGEDWRVDTVTCPRP